MMKQILIFVVMNAIQMQAYCQSNQCSEQDKSHIAESGTSSALKFVEFTEPAEMFYLVYPRKSAEDVVRLYIDKIKYDFGSAVPALLQWTHPDEKARFKSMVLSVFEGRMQKKSKQFSQALFGSDATLESLRQVPPDEFILKYMLYFEESIPGFAIKVKNQEIIGSIREADLVHVVVRVTIASGEVEIQKTEIISLKPYQYSWRILLNGKIDHAFILNNFQ